ncbi:hypothetical protein EK21DRAFT_108689 [Setomelanomma holmii]|uniref:Uncharacterized protein n=1 Tax=Setomelanomma holmii TaxID=210430 RepID=A0A9P4LQ73_9PLEO|nr:hypothetical protein EK21DRAFT_108689 [Setomelanomma holmii]
MEGDAVPPSSPPQATTNRRSSSPFFEPRESTYCPKSSSPPPLFSSDDSRESDDVANYESPRIFKNKRKGAWWDNVESAQKSPALKKAKMTRNYDSGVYMLSDATDSSESLPAQHKSPFSLGDACATPPRDDPLPQPTIMGEEERNFCRGMYTGLEKNSEVYDFGNLYLQDSNIRRIGELASVIRNGPDPGQELPAEGQYRSMIPEIYVNLKDNRLHRLTPALFDLQNLTTLVISGNNIEELPPQIGKLRNLCEMIISRNNMKWLPFEFLSLYQPCGPRGVRIIGDSGVPWLEPKTRQVLTRASAGHAVTRLDDLHDDLLASFNKEVPWSDLDLVAHPKMKALHELVDTFANREQWVWYMRNLELSAADAARQILSRTRGAWDSDETGLFPHHPTIVHAGGPRDEQPRYYARTPVSYFDSTGTLIKGSPEPPTSNDDDFAVITDTLRGAHGAPSTWFTPPDFRAVNSLATMALHAALRQKDQEDLSIADLRHHISDPVPPLADALFKQAEANDGPGYGEFKKCHVCSKEYVIARSQWIEWWCPVGMVVLPFRVQVCSWACVPDEMRAKPQNELVW